MQELYNGIILLFCNIIHSAESAMILCHSWGFNGFKRKYRCMARYFQNLKMLLENEMFDKHRLIYTHENNISESAPYHAENFKGHFTLWDIFLKTNIDKISDYNKRMFAITGIENEYIKKALCILFKDYEKTGRYYKRFSEGAWLPHDMHIVDDMLHIKMKEKEEKEFAGWK